MTINANPRQNSTNNVAGISPLSSQQSVGQEQQNKAPTAGGAVSNSSASNQLPKPPKQASTGSGLFKNVQGYINRNQAQASNLANKVTSDFSKQADSVRQAVVDKTNQQQTLLNSAQDIMGKQKQEAQGIVNKVNTYQGDASAPILSNEEVNQFKNIASGSNLQTVNDLNLVNEQNRGTQLLNQAKNINTEQGRQDLLKQTFNKINPYTQGQSALDNYILSGNKAAQEALYTNTQAKAKALQKLQQDASGLVDQTNQYRLDQQNFGNTINKIASGAETNLDTSLQDQLNAIKAQYGMGEGVTVDNLTGDLANLNTGAQEQYNQNIANYNQQLATLLNPIGNWANNVPQLSYSSARGHNPYRGFINSQINEINSAKKLNTDFLKDYGENNDQVQNQLQNYINKVKNTGSLPSLNGIQNVQLTPNTTTNALQKLLENKYKENTANQGQAIDINALTSGSFLDKEGIASKQQGLQAQALANLLGKSNNILNYMPENDNLGEDTAFLENLRKSSGLA